MLHTIRDPQQLRMVKDVRWVKAHRNLQEAASPEEAWLIKANDLADDAAKRAVGLHPQQDLASAAWADFYTRRFPHAVKATAIALAMFPPAAGNLKRHPPAQSREEAIKRNRHLWTREGEIWRCEMCWDWATKPPKRTYRQRQLCSGPVENTEASKLAGWGHAICKADGYPSFLFCTRCGGTKAKRTRALNQNCGEPTRNGRLALSRIAKNTHPWQKRDKATGQALPRGAISVRRKHDPTMNGWARNRSTATFTGADTKRRKTASHEEEQDRGSAQMEATRNGQAELRDEHAEEDPHEEWMELPPPDNHIEHTAAEEEEDVFGHGGDMDNNIAPNHNEQGSTGPGETEQYEARWTYNSIGREPRAATYRINQRRGTITLLSETEEIMWTDHAAAALLWGKQGERHLTIHDAQASLTFHNSEHRNEVMRTISTTYINCDKCEGGIMTKDLHYRPKCKHGVCGGCRANHENSGIDEVCARCYLEAAYPGHPPKSRRRLNNPEESERAAGEISSAIDEPHQERPQRKANGGSAHNTDGRGHTTTTEHTEHLGEDKEECTAGHGGRTGVSLEEEGNSSQHEPMTRASTRPKCTRTTELTMYRESGTDRYSGRGRKTEELAGNPPSMNATVGSGIGVEITGKYDSTKGGKGMRRERKEQHQRTGPQHGQGIGSSSSFCGARGGQQQSQESQQGKKQTEVDLNRVQRIIDPPGHSIQTLFESAADGARLGEDKCEIDRSCQATQDSRQAGATRCETT